MNAHASTHAQDEPGHSAATSKAVPEHLAESPSQNPLNSECRLLLQHTRETIKSSESHINWGITLGIAAVGTVIAVLAVTGATNYWNLTSQMTDIQNQVVALEGKAAAFEARIKHLENNQFFTFDPKTGMITTKDSIPAPDK